MHRSVGILNDERVLTQAWVGIDGSDVIAHFPPADTYNCECFVSEILRSEQNQADRHLSPRSLMLFGIG